MKPADPQLNYSMRPSDKETERTSQYEDLFDQCVDSATFDLDPDSGLTSGSSGGGLCFGTPASPGRECPLGSPSAYAADINSFGELYKSPVLYPLNDPSFSRPNTPSSATSTPPSPRSQRTRPQNQSIALLANERRSSSVGVRKPYRRLTTTPNMTQSMVSPCAPHDIWAQKLQAGAEKCNLPYIYQSGPLSPPPSVKLNEWDDQSFTSSQFESQPEYHRSFSSHHLHLASQTHPPLQKNQSHYTPISSPSQDAQHNQPAYFNQMQSEFSATYFHDQFSNTVMSAFASPNQDQEVPCQDMPGEAMPFSFGASSSYQGPAVQPWWCSPNTSRPAEESTYPRTRHYSHGPSSSIGSDSYMGSSTAVDASMASRGLMIECPPPQQNVKSYEAGSHALAPPTATYDHSTHSGMASPRRLHREPSNESVAASPTTQQSRSRRGSRGNRRAKPAANGSSPKVSIDFVNYTPDDESTILTGVAPSGSSKTKARREKEAAEKRRRLSQAAIKTVLEAGGDPSALEKVLLE